MYMQMLADVCDSDEKKRTVHVTDDVHLDCTYLHNYCCSVQAMQVKRRLVEIAICFKRK